MDFRETNYESSNTTDWIEILLNIAIPDGRHRIIGTVLAPYLINVKGLQVSEAEKIIGSWLEKCDRYEPVKGNIEAFVKRSCLNAYRLGKKPKDINYFKTHHNTIYREIVSMAHSYELEIE